MARTKRSKRTGPLYRRRWPSTMQAALYHNQRRRKDLLAEGGEGGFQGPPWALNLLTPSDNMSQIIWDDSGTWQDGRTWEENF